MIFVLGGPFVFWCIRSAIEIDNRFFSGDPVTTINAFFVFRETWTRIGGITPVSRIVNASMTSFVNRSVII